MKIYIKWIGLFLALNSVPVFANNNLIRWTHAEDQDGKIDHVVQVLNQKLGRTYKVSDFILQEERDLAFNHYQRWAQTLNHFPIHGKSIRIWTETNTDRVVQVEADLEKPSVLRNAQRMLAFEHKSASAMQADLSSEKTIALSRQSIQTDLDDPNLRGLSWVDEWRKSEFFRKVRVRGLRGYHTVWISLRTQRVIQREYREFPQGELPSDRPAASGECDSAGPGSSKGACLTIPVQVYPIYEEVEGEAGILPRVKAELRYIQPSVRQVLGDIYAPLKTQRYFESKYDPNLGETVEGRAKGYWAMSYLKREAARIRNSLPLAPNEFLQGVVLEGRFATINIHPDAIQKFEKLSFVPQNSPSLFPNWMQGPADSEPELSLGTAFFGKPLRSPDEVWNRPARRLADHDPLTYLEDGFDELQVYYAINTLFDSLRNQGFQDPDLSTRPFNAFLFNPDIAYRDNAYYTDDTINFTTYSPKAGNAARDNSTIWHELGHGVMDRLMGDHIELADTGGLSEGMADFIAALVVQSVSQGVPFPGSDRFRIINKTGFNLTNEVHDDGESYGGAMKDFLDTVIQAQGQAGLRKVTDVVLETMRLTRDYPGLTAQDWFNHLLFADSLGRNAVREPGELKSYLLAALGGRNFKLDGGSVASFKLMNEGSQQEVVAGAPGSRNSPILVSIPEAGSAEYKIGASLKSSDGYAFQYPVEVRVQFTGGPLQGAVHWVGKEQGTQTYVLNSEADTAQIPLRVTGKCDEVNRADGSCVDYAYVQIWNHGETKRPVAKKRFYLRIKNPS